MEDNYWIYLGGTILLLIVLFLLLREVVCWYLKINDNLKIQKEQLTYLKRIADHLAPLKTKAIISTKEGSADNEIKKLLVDGYRSEAIVYAKEHLFLETRAAAEYVDDISKTM